MFKNFYDFVARGGKKLNFVVKIFEVIENLKQFLCAKFKGFMVSFNTYLKSMKSDASNFIYASKYFKLTFKLFNWSKFLK